MLGYVTVNKDELSESELRVYRGYYCGICKSMSRYGQFPRLALSYDSVFIAMLLNSLNDAPEELSEEHCIVHHIKKNPVVRNVSAIDYSADMLTILAYYNFLDDKSDEHKVRGILGETFLKKAYGDLSEKYAKATEEIKKSIDKLSALEKVKSPSLDETSSAFGEVLRSVFCGFYDNQDINRILGELSYNLGRWIYIMDALDDIESDQKSGTYNPLIYREEGMANLNDTLYNYLGRVVVSLDLLDIKKNKGIIDNVVFFGLRGRTDALLTKSME